MNKKTKLIALFSTAAVIAAASFALSLVHPSFIKARSVDGDYTITINPDDITTSTTSTNGQVVVKTDQLKNDVKINFENVKRDGDNLVILENGFVANAYDSQIRSMKTLTVFGDNSDNFDYFFGWDVTGSTVNYVESDYFWADGADIDLTSYVPNYFKVGYRSIPVRITKIVIELDKDCVVGENPVVIQGGLKYRKVGNDHAMLVGFADTAFADVVVADTVEGLPVTEIGERAFYYNTTIESIDLGANVRKIGSYAFTFTNNLTTIVGLDNVTYFDQYAFYGSSISCDINFSSSLSLISNCAFMDTEITNVTFADTGNPEVQDGAFRSCTELLSIYIGNEMRQFGDDFYQSTNLQSITVGAENTKYHATENVLFNDVDDIVICIAGSRPQTSFTVPSGYTLKGYCAFANQTLESLTLNDTVYRIPDYSFNWSPNLRTITFGSYDGLEIQDAFEGCTSLERLVIPSTVTTIGQHAFKDCTSLKTVIIEEGCTTINRCAFQGCTNLMNVLLPSSLTSLGESGGWDSEPVDVFDGCTKLTKICTKLTSGTYSGEHIVSGWDGGRSLAYESDVKNTDGNHWRMVDGTPRIWGVSVTFKVYRDVGLGNAVYFLGSFNGWIADVESRGNYVSDHWELVIELVPGDNYEFKAAVGGWDAPGVLSFEAGSNHSWTPDNDAFEYVINWQYTD